MCKAYNQNFKLKFQFKYFNDSASFIECVVKTIELSLLLRLYYKVVHKYLKLILFVKIILNTY